MANQNHKTSNNPIKLLVKLCLFGVFAVMHGFERMIDKVGNMGGSGRSDYNIGNPDPTTRSESYRKMKRRNRLMRKFDHKRDDGE